MDRMEHVIDVTDETFEQVVVEGSKTAPVVVDLWAAWCGPCRTLGPMLEEAATKRDGAFTLAKIDVDAQGVGNALLQAVQSQSIPTVVAFRDGQPVSMFIGAIPQPEIDRFLDSILPSEAEVDAKEAAEELAAGDVGEAEHLHAKIEVAEWATLPPNGRLGQARQAAARGAWSEAFEGMFAALADQRDDARQALITSFAALGDDDPLVPEYRRRLAAALF